MNCASVSGNRSLTRNLTLWLVAACMAAPPAFAQRTRLKPGMNFFSPQQDVELGGQVAQDAEQKLVMLKDPRVDDYLDKLGKRLAANAPGEKYPYQFKCVNDPSINAFALPGGFLFINRGAIEAADNEAELAGVIGHEIGHVALRHGTNQASKSSLAQAPLAILGSFMGNSSAAAIAAQIGTSFALNSVLLKYSRDDERQADLMGTQILYDSNYDPRSMARFFEKLDTGGKGSDFFSSHPNPENRMQHINAEIDKLGEQSAAPVNDTNEFRSVQKYLKSLPPAPKTDSQPPQSKGAGKTSRPPRPSDRLQSYDAGNVRLSFPDNWKSFGKGQSLTLAPEGGVVGSGNNSALAYGAIMEVFTPRGSGSSGVGLKDATDQLISSLLSSNSGMSVAEKQPQSRVGGQTAASTILTNDSPLGGRETDWLIAVLRPEGLAYFVFVAPEQEFSDYKRAFQKILDSVSFSNR